MPTKPTSTTDQPNETTTGVAGERKRDEQRDNAGPAYGGDAWKAADERGEQRFGTARNDDADPSTLTKGDPDDADADPAVEGSGEQAGMGRGESPHKR